MNPTKILRLFCTAIFSIILVDSIIACVARSDTIDQAALDTQRILKTYERTRDPKEINSWLIDYHGEAPGHQVMTTLVQWSLEHQSDFITIIDGIRQDKQHEFVEKFAFALTDTALDKEFKERFKHHQSKVLTSILANLP